MYKKLNILKVKLKHLLIVGIIFWLVITANSLLAADKNIPSLPKVLVLGDSLSAAYQLPIEQGWVNLMALKLAGKAEVINASISGETTSGGLRRLPNLLAEHKPSLVLLELGANDGLRGLPLETMHANLAKIIDLSRAADANLVLLGITLPPNYGARYINRFNDVYNSLAKNYSLPYLPFLLKGVAEDSNLMQNDGLHPKASAQPIILNNVWPLVEPFFN